ncbi:MAG: hypothetical protein K9I59_05375 [Chlorobium sp.]|uniref:DUF883 family protein n=1 Tax=Chlorobium sp. TaxID=1095 RepID=UPI0025BB7291|nr:hypothetical protein [Chlorobium sp.]MCF8216207.1 hypothetical protein [Chlorobium sp.]MCF8271070.1 hypothetical protein [Chlorobium sp.]MCF8287483.1 hypothetical protein [Chlorobium sp.]MCF8290983.1 hypothetical protein [Chlorobium sp.]MCF8385078.1 hypothetical protein [Chlorobium sp.]
MEQEVPVVIHNSNEPDPGTHAASPIPEQVKELGSTVSEAVTSFMESEQYEQLKEAAAKVKSYIRENPVPSMLYTLGAGALLGFILKRRH